MGSSYIFSLKPGDIVTGIGPFGDFHIKPTQREMVYIGGGAGMAPLRGHLSNLLETERTARKISFWYGARSTQELFYQDYFDGLAKAHPNFQFHLFPLRNRRNGGADMSASSMSPSDSSHRRILSLRPADDDQVLHQDAGGAWRPVSSDRLR